MKRDEKTLQKREKMLRKSDEKFRKRRETNVPKRRSIFMKIDCNQVSNDVKFSRDFLEFLPFTPKI